MTHRSVSEWGKVSVAAEGDGFTRNEANALVAAARSHSLGGQEGAGILSDHYRYLRAKQMVGVIAAPGCSLEILPKVDSGEAEPDAVERPTVRRRLMHMLDFALGLDVGEGALTTMARQDDSLLDMLIRLFADRLLAETRRGLPRAYHAREDDLPALRGRLDVARQFSVHAVRPDRLACRYDTLSADTALMQVMKACVVSLRKHARAAETQRRLDELRFILSDIADVPRALLRWDRIHLDRTNRRWNTLLTLARLFLRREWQATHHDQRQDSGVSLLFPMNDLFEAFVAALLRRALSGSGIEVVAQGGLRHCLGEWRDEEECRGHLFQTKPDIILRQNGRVLAVIDTKWKSLAANPLDRKNGVAQADIYQMMAYARLYRCDRLMLLYPAAPGQADGIVRQFGIDGGNELLALAKLDVSRNSPSLVTKLAQLAHELTALPMSVAS